MMEKLGGRFELVWHFFSTFAVPLESIRYRGSWCIKVFIQFQVMVRKCVVRTQGKRCGCCVPRKE